MLSEPTRKVSEIRTWDALSRLKRRIRKTLYELFNHKYSTEPINNHLRRQMDWEDKFTSIVKETESNLARVRDRLGSSRTRHGTQSKYYSSPNLEPSSQKFDSGLSQSLENLHPRATMYSSGNPQLKSSSTPSKSLYDVSGFQSTSPQRISGITNQNSASNSSALLNVLFERIEQQAETLDSLSRTVKKLEKEKSSQADIISTLQDQVSRLNDRLREHGVDLETERKLEGFKREMYSHLERIQSQNRLQQNRDDSSYGDPSNATLARDLHENKRLLQDDCNSLRREVDHLKTRIGKIELEAQSTMADAKDSNRRLDRIDRTVTILSENQRSQSHSLESIVDDRELRNSEVGSIRQKIDELSRRISELESDSEGQRKGQRKGQSLGTRSGRSKPAHAQTKGKPHSLMNGHNSMLTTPSNNKHKSTKSNELDVSLSDSDLDTSAALLGLSSGSDSEITSVQTNTHSYQADVNDEISDLSSTSLSSLNSDELLGL